MKNLKINVEEILEYYSLNNISSYGDEVNFSCPFPEHHRGDQRPSSYINTETGRYNCFGCDRSGSIVTFVAELESISTENAEQLIEKGFTQEFLEKNSLTDYLKRVAEPKEEVREQTISEHALDQFKVDWYKASDAWVEQQLPSRLCSLFDRGFSPDILTVWQIGYDQKSKRISIPARNEDGVLVGFKGRATDKRQTPKYSNLGDRPNKPIYYGFKPYKIGNIVWGLNSASEDGIIVEGELDAIWLRQAGYEGAVSIGGSNPTKRQTALFRQRLRSATLFFDKDEGKIAGDKAERKLTNSLLQSFPVKIASCLPGKDPQQHTKEELHRVIENAKHVKLI